MCLRCVVEDNHWLPAQSKEQSSSTWLCWLIKSKPFILKSRADWSQAHALPGFIYWPLPHLLFHPSHQCQHQDFFGFRSCPRGPWFLLVPSMPGRQRITSQVDPVQQEMSGAPKGLDNLCTIPVSGARPYFWTQTCIWNWDLGSAGQLAVSWG